MSTRSGTRMKGNPVSEVDRAISPGAARRQLGSLLKALRERADLRLDQAGKHIQRSTATLSRLENGKSVPRLVDVRALLDLYDDTIPGQISQDERDRVMLLAADSRQQAWFDPFRDVITGGMTQDHMQRYVEWETDAEEILTYQAETVPGLLQTRGYAQALADLFFPDASAAQRKRFVDFRLARQGVLKRRPVPLELRVTLREVALRRVVGSAAVMVDQLGKLAEELRNGVKNVEIRIVPDRLVAPEVLRGAFTVMRLPDRDEGDGDGLVYLEGAGGGDYLQNAESVERYRKDFATLWAASLTQEESLGLIEEVIDSIA